MMQLDSNCDFIKLNVSNSKNDNVAIEIKFLKSFTIEQLKQKLEVITGGNAATMKLQLYNGDNLVMNLNDGAVILGSLPLSSGMRLHVVDNFSWISEEVVDKFELSDDQYQSRTDTVRNFLKRNNVGHYDNEELKKREEKRLELINREEMQAKLCSLGKRCQVKVVGNPTRLGTIMYNGPIEGKTGIFIGVQYDEPLGKNNGSLNGKKYFECPMNYGGFVSPLSVECGDFPATDYNLEDEI